MSVTAGSEFADIIRERTEHFAGRDWVFRAVDAWLRGPGSARTFLLVGGPGTGKSALAARLAQASFGDVTLDGCPAIQRGFLTYVHFCQAGRDSTLSPTTFVQSLSEALANRLQGFRSELERQGSQQIVINAPVNVQGSVGDGARVGTEIGQVRIEIRGGDARPMFDVAVRRPLKALAASGTLDPIVVLVDSLDEALTFSGDTNIVRLLQVVNDLPPQVRFVLTSRANNERVTDLVGPPALDLVVRADDDVATYANAWLAALPEPARSDLVRRVAARSAGNFLYAYHVLNTLAARGTAAAELDSVELPEGLDGVYRSFLARELAANDERWRAEFRPLLGTIVVARGDGLTREQLVGVTQLTDERLDDLLRVLRQYLVGGAKPSDPLRIYHHSFREFLLADEDYQVYPAARHAALADFLLKKFGRTLNKGPDTYALRHTPVHLAEAASGAAAAREALVRQLIELTSTVKYQDRCDAQLGDIPMLSDHMARTVAAAAACESDEMLPWLARAGLAFTAFRERFLQGARVFELANSGDTASAEARLPLFAGLDQDWQTAASLIIAWLAVRPNESGAAAIVSRVAKTPPQEAPLSILLDRVQAALDGKASFDDIERAPAADLYTAEQLVRRISGQSMNPEFIQKLQPIWQQSEMIQGLGYAASLDGPMLVHIAREHGDAGTAFVDQYIDAHSGYNYVEYRNKSLWMMLHAVLRHHPDQSWVLARLTRILGVALMKGGAEFVEGAPLFAAVLLEQARGSDARAVADAYGQQTGERLSVLQNERGSNDSWSLHRRRLVARLELESLAFGDDMRARQVLMDIRQREQSGVLEGFAGFQAPAMARFADALLATHIAPPDEIAATVGMAVKIAHRIQDFRFCARMTARCQTLQRWHERVLTAPDLEMLLDRLETSPDDVAFAAYHVVGDPYTFRNHGSPETLPIAEAQAANTLERLADVFQRPALAFVRLNPTLGLDTILSPGTEVAVPDPGLLPLLAIHLAARIVGEPALDGRRGALIRRLVPFAAANATAFDSVLGYLLVASQIEDVPTLEALADILGPPGLRDAANPTGGVLVNHKAIPA